LTAHRRDDPDAPLFAGDWCQFCPVKHCVAHQQWVLEAPPSRFR